MNLLQLDRVDMKVSNGLECFTENYIVGFGSYPQIYLWVMGTSDGDSNIAFSSIFEVGIVGKEFFGLFFIDG